MNTKEKFEPEKLKTIIIKTNKETNEHELICKKCKSNNIISIEERYNCRVNVITNLNTRESHDMLIEEGELEEYSLKCYSCDKQIHYEDVSYLQENSLIW